MPIIRVAIVTLLCSCGKHYKIMSMQHWMKVASGKMPPGREFHTACCIAGPLTGQEHLLLMVAGGYGYEGMVFSDVWLLDVDKGVWSEVGMLYQIV